MHKVVLGLGGLALTAAAIVTGCASNNTDGFGGAGGTGGASATSTNATTATHATSGPTTTATSATSATSTNATTSTTSTTNQSATSTTVSTGTGGPPPSWTCDPGFYAAADGCDCGCGALDPDCATSALADCEICDDTGSCSNASNGCPGFIDPANTAGCVAPSPENTPATCHDGIDNDQDGAADCADTDCSALAECIPPALWACDSSHYGTADGCNCGCGAADPDCANNAIATCDVCDSIGSCSAASNGCPGFIDPANTIGCLPATPENTDAACADGIDNDQDGATDCADSDCLGHGTCPPVGWTCDPTFYNDGTDCNCGCGVKDVDCADLLVASCNICDDTGSCSQNGSCPGFINPTNNAKCVAAVPENTDARCSDGLDNDQDGNIDCADPDCQGHSTCPPVAWTCDLGFYGSQDGCDCGCGAHDPDCADNLIGSCLDCADSGSCSTTDCPGTIKPADNAHCN